MVIYLKHGHVIDLGDVKCVRYDSGDKEIPMLKYAQEGEEVFGLPEKTTHIEQIEFRSDNLSVFTCYADDIVAVKEEL